jgi:hypothetical protein
LIPFFTAPLTNCSLYFAMISGIFLPIAFRRPSASAIVKPAITLAIFMTCSW